MATDGQVLAFPGSPATDDHALLTRCVDGDDRAIAQFVARFQADVMRFLSRMLGPTDPGLDDLVQLTFVAALDAGHRFDGRSAIRTWLLGIAHNKVRMELRSRMRRRRAMDLLARFRLVHKPAPPDRLQAREIGQRIQEALLQLHPDLRAAFVLCDVNGMTAKDAAEALGVPAGTLRRRRSEAKQRLQPLLADLRVGEDTP